MASISTSSSSSSSPRLPNTTAGVYMSFVNVEKYFIIVISEPDSLSVQILCFSHCKKQVFCTGSLPSSCPSCHQDITSCHLDIPPFALPSPFMRASDYPSSIVIKPSKGDQICKILALLSANAMIDFIYLVMKCPEDRLSDFSK